MSESLLDSVASRWMRLGAMLNVEASPRTPDVDRLLLDTARTGSANSRLFILAASWLARHRDYVDEHRLARLIRGELEAEHRPALGLLLEWAGEHRAADGSSFDAAVEACGSAIDAYPLFDVERRNTVFARLAEQRASALSRKWGRWMADFSPKENALRPREWIAEHNPTLRVPVPAEDTDDD